MLKDRPTLTCMIHQNTKTKFSASIHLRTHHKVVLLMCKREYILGKMFSVW